MKLRNKNLESLHQIMNNMRLDPKAANPNDKMRILEKVIKKYDGKLKFRVDLQFVSDFLLEYAEKEVSGEEEVKEWVSSYKETSKKNSRSVSLDSVKEIKDPDSIDRNDDTSIVEKEEEKMEEYRKRESRIDKIKGSNLSYLYKESLISYVDKAYISDLLTIFTYEGKARILKEAFEEAKGKFPKDIEEKS